MKFSIKDFFSKCDQIRNFLRIWSHLLKKSIISNFIFCAVDTTMSKLLEWWVDSSTLLILRTHWRVIFGKVIRCSTLRLWVGLTISILRLCSFNGCLKLDSHLSEKPFFFYFYENPLKMMKNAFCLILKAFFVLKIFFSILISTH